MQIVHVFVEVKPGQFDAFREATLANLQQSRQEAGVLQFDFFQEETNPAKFLLIEAYQDPEASALHKQTPHYQTWRDTVAPMMAQPRYSIRYVNVSPAEGTPARS